MRMRRLEELRNVHLDIKGKREKGNQTDNQKDEAMIWKAVERITELSNLARREGLLRLEEEVETIALESEEEVLKQLLLLLVDGTEPVFLEEIGMSRYFAHLYSDYEALRYLIFLEGTLAIQAGMNPRLFEEKIKVMLPSDMYLEYSVKQEKKAAELVKMAEENLIERLCKGERVWDVGAGGYHVSRLLDYAVCDITDKELQRVLREVTNTTLTLAMKGMSGTARRHIFSNLSERLAKMVAEDIIEMGSVRATDILEASQTILNVLIQLIDRGEIAGRYEYLIPFYQVVTVDTDKFQEKNHKLEELKQMVAEYEQSFQMVKESID